MKGPKRLVSGIKNIFYIIVLTFRALFRQKEYHAFQYRLRVLRVAMAFTRSQTRNLRYRDSLQEEYSIVASRF